MSKNDKADQSGQLFGIFSLDKALYAIELTGLQEIIVPPEKIQTAPHCPYFMEGLFDLRGRVIPLIHTKSLLEQKEVRTDPTSGVCVILKDGNARLGARFDGTQSVIRVQPQEISQFEYSSEESPLPVRGVLRPKGTDSFIPILDIQRVLKFSQLPVFSSSADVVQDPKNFEAEQNLRTFLSLQVEDSVLGIETRHISEILSLSKIERNVLSDDFYLGSFLLRGQCLPVLSLAKVLDLNEVPAERPYVIVVEHQKKLFAFKVDHFKALTKVSEKQVQKNPVLDSFQGEYVEGSILSDGGLILLNSEGVFGSEKVQKALKNHQNLYGSIEKKTSSQKAQKEVKSSRSSFMVFHLKQRFAMPMINIAEILDGKQDLHPSVHVPKSILGFLNLRGEAVPIIEPYDIYGLGQAPSLAEGKIILFSTVKGKFGIRVDHIETILSLDLNVELPLPEILFQETQRRYSEELQGGVVTKSEDGSNQGLLLLKPEDFISKLQLIAEEYRQVLKSAA